MSQVITKRNRVSRRRFLRGLTAVGFGNHGGPAAAGCDVQLHRYRLCGSGCDPGADREPVRVVVQRQRNPRALLDSGGNRTRFPPDAVPRAAGAVPERHSRDQRPRQFGGGLARSGQRPSQFDERPDDLHARSPAAAPAGLRSTRRSPRRSAANRASARCRSASRRNRSAKAFSAI